MRNIFATVIGLLLIAHATQGNEDEGTCRKANLRDIILSCAVQTAVRYFTRIGDEGDDFNSVIESDLYDSDLLFKTFFKADEISTDRYIFATTRLTYAQSDKLDTELSYTTQTIFLIKAQAYAEARRQAGLAILAAINERDGLDLADVQNDMDIDKETEDLLKVVVFSVLETIRILSTPDEFASFLSLKVGGTLGIVMDTTGSMGEEIAAAQNVSEEIVRSTKGTIREPQFYILVGFNDPSVVGPFITSDSEQFIKEINALRANGGEDFAEQALLGIFKALVVSHPMSEIWMFTDAATKMPELAKAINAITNYQKIRVNIIVTQNSHLFDQTLYKDITRSSAGNILFLQRSEIPFALAMMKSSIPQKSYLDIIHNSNEDANWFYVDSSFTTFDILLNGEIADGEIRMTYNDELVEYDMVSTSAKAKLLEIKNPMPGSYGVFVPSGSTVSIIARGESNLGVFVKLDQTINGKTRSKGLVAGYDTTASVDVYGSTENLKLEYFILYNRNTGETLIQVDLIGCDNHYVTDTFTMPGENMFAYVLGSTNGVDQNFVRVDPCPINPIQIFSEITGDKTMTLTRAESKKANFTFHALQNSGTFSVSVVNPLDVTEVLNKESITVAEDDEVDITVQLTAKDRDYGDDEDGAELLLVIAGEQDSYVWPFVVAIVKDTTTCSIFPPVLHGKTTCTDGVKSGSTCTLECDDFFNPKEGVISITCQGSEWSTDFGGCEPVGKGQCDIRGDPHYTTFDRKKYDFMGICKYTAVSTSDFEVFVENEHRGNTQRVSYASKVWVELPGISIQLKKGHVVMINGIEVQYPHEPKLFKINKIGHNVVATLKGGVSVSFDGTNVRIIIPGSYKGNTTGLCGNFDDDASNEFGNHTKAIDFGNSFEVGGIHDHCADEGLTVCEKNSTAEANAINECSIMKSETFENCDNTIIGVLFEECVTDICAYNGEVKEVLYLALDNLAVTCQNNGDDVDDWRKETDTPKVCGPNEYYTSQASQCQNDCVRRNQERLCNLPKIGGCVCQQGHIRSGSTCVKVSECGCQLDKQYYKLREFYYNDNCTTRCECKESGKVECETTSCQQGEKCEVQQGIRQCVPESYGTATAYGDPHFTTFDGDKYDFMGICTYLFVGFEIRDHGMFNVYLDLEHRNGNTRVSYVRQVMIHFGSYEIALTKDRTAVWGGNEENQFDEPMGLFAITKSGGLIRLRSFGGIEVTFNGNAGATVTVPSIYSNKTRGLGGDFNGVADMHITEDPDMYGLSQVFDNDDDDDCEAVVPEEPFVCDNTTKWEGDEYCGRLKSDIEPFKSCQAHVDPTKFFDACVLDACATDGNADVIKAAFETYAVLCERHVEMCGWRAALGFDLSCPENSEYKCDATCQATCTGIPPRNCPKENCICKFGFVMAPTGECIPREQCGCTISQQRYRLPGYSHTFENCMGYEECKAGGVWTKLEGYICADNESCKKNSADEWACFPRESPVAQVFGTMHFITFAGQHFTFKGTCAYAFFHLKKSEDYEIAVAVVSRMDWWRQVSVKQLKVYSHMKDGKEAVYTLDEDGSIWNGDYRLTIDTIGDGFVTYKSGRFSVLRLNAGVEVRFDGHFNWGQVAFDPVLEEYVQPSLSNAEVEGHIDYTKWAHLYKIKEFSDDNCVATMEVTKCLIEETNKLYMSVNHCGAIKTAAFEACHEKIDPEPYIAACVAIDACAMFGNPLKIALAVSAYAENCRRKAVVIGKEWRVVTGIPMMCGAHSHYVSNAAPCQPTCNDRKVQKCNRAAYTRVKEIETCVCDEGYILSGGQCVEKEKCGCIGNDGISYFAHGECTGDEKCNNECACLKGEWNCEAKTCSDKQYCGIGPVTGKWGCFWKDSCAYDNGGCSHYCTFVANKKMCKCPGGYALGEDGKNCFKTIGCAGGHGRCSTEYNKNLEMWKREVTVWKQEMREYKCEQSDLCTGVTTSGWWWTMWFDRDDPNGCGDEETIESLRQEVPKMMCSYNEDVVAMQYKLVDAKMSMGNLNLHADVEKGGFKCLNAEQDDSKCPDFKVRYLCIPKWCDKADPFHMP